MTAGVILGSLRSELTVPTGALTQRDGKALVWVVTPASSQVQPREVVTGPYREDGVVVEKGLAAGERVVIAGVHKLIPGQVVRPVEPALAPLPVVGAGAAK